MGGEPRRPADPAGADQVTLPPDIAAILPVLARDACRDVALLADVGEDPVSVRQYQDWTVIVCQGETGEQLIQSLRDKDASIQQSKESQ